MRVVIDGTDVRREAVRLAGAGERLLGELERRAFALGKDAVRFIQRRHRTGGTSETRTRQRTGRLYDAYDSTVERFDDHGSRGVDLAVGLIKPGVDDEVLLYGRVQEGINAAGERVAGFTILPRASEWLKFKLPEDRGGHWVMTKKVYLPASRAALPDVEERLPPFLDKEYAGAFAAAVGT